MAGYVAAGVWREPQMQGGSQPHEECDDQEGDLEVFRSQLICAAEGLRCFQN